jgi:hypothetical protein
MKITIYNDSSKTDAEALGLVQTVVYAKRISDKSHRFDVV